ncbi:MAG: hypothetical protein OEZ43_05255 [Gammaproteobacteria bacterium]|nr:hypothetical protein [Gammaproteobacteria bacterium]
MNVPLYQEYASSTVLFETVVIVTKATVLEELVKRFNTQAQAKFYLEHAGQDFEAIRGKHEEYTQIVTQVRNAIPRGFRVQVLDRSLLPQYVFTKSDLIVVIGPDGLVVNTAKYVNENQPIVAVNPDTTAIDGVLLPFTRESIFNGLEKTLLGKFRVKEITMAEVRLNDGQTLLAFNDLFIGAQSHVSARYDIRQGEKFEHHSSSGVIVSTGAGSTGWLRSVYAGATAIVEALGGKVTPPPNNGSIPWDSEYLIYSVREPFPSKSTQAQMVYGVITQDKPLIVTSNMASGGTIFSDGVEADRVEFNAGIIANIGLAKQRTHLVV